MSGGALSLAASGSRWAVATPHSAATDAAASALISGGNAVDAALAAATMLAVAYPHMCGVGGDLFALVRDPSGTTRAVISAGAAPSGIDVDAVRERHGGVMPEHGPDTVTVPGVVAGWQALHDLGGRLPWREPLEGAARAAREGVAVAGDLAATLAWGAERFRADPGLAGVYFDGERALGEGETLRQPALAETLDALGKDGPQAMYGGEVGRAYASGMSATGSALTIEDLEAHRHEVAGPMVGRFRDLTVLTAPPPSQGYLLLRILAAATDLDPRVDPLGAHALALARIFASASEHRDRVLADPLHMTVTMDELLASPPPATRPGPQPGGTGDTISLTTADADGWAVSLIQSLYDAFGSGILEPATGIVAHDRGACFTLDPGHPNELGPGKRPAHTLMPVLVERGGALAAVAGTMGGEAQPQVNAQNLLRAFDLGMAPLDALAAPRWSVEGTLATLEPGVPDEVAEALSAGGFDIARTDAEEGLIGHSNLIACAAEGFDAASDPRSDGSARAG